MQIFRPLVLKLLLAILLLIIGIVCGLGWDEVYQRWIFRKSIFARSTTEITQYCLSCPLPPTILASFERLRRAKMLYEKGCPKEARKMLEMGSENSLWIEPEILQETGLWALAEGSRSLAYDRWLHLSQKYPYSKAFHKIYRHFALLHTKQGRSNVSNSP